METQLRDEMDELIAKYESDTAVKQALHDQVGFLFPPLQLFNVTTSVLGIIYVAWVSSFLESAEQMGNVANCTHL